MIQNNSFASLFEEPRKPSGPVACLGLTFENDEEQRKYFTEKLRAKLQDPEFRKIEDFSHGIGRGRIYTLSVKIYQNAGKKFEYIRQAGFAPIQQEQMVLNYINKHGSIKRADAADLCHISPFQASRLLKRMKDNGLIKSIGQGKGTRYERK